MSRTLAGFAKELRRIAPPGSRPFVCDGSPLECEAFIVGERVATTGLDFWRFWSDERGFDRSAFLEAYKAERQERKAERAHRKQERKDHEVVGISPEGTGGADGVGQTQGRASSF